MWWSHGIPSNLCNSEASVGITVGSCGSGWRPGLGCVSGAGVGRGGGEASREQGLGVLQGFSERGGREVVRKQEESRESVWGFQKRTWRGRTEIGPWFSPKKQCC